MLPLALVLLAPLPSWSCLQWLYFRLSLSSGGLTWYFLHLFSPFSTPHHLTHLLKESADCPMVLFSRFSLPLLSPGFDCDITDGGWTLPALLAPDLAKSQLRIRVSHILDHAGFHRTLCHFSSSVSLYRNVPHALPDTSVSKRQASLLPFRNSPLLLAEHRALSSRHVSIFFIYKMALASQYSDLPLRPSSLLGLLAHPVSWHMSAPGFRIPG